jgi:hypothetical protein
MSASNEILNDATVVKYLAGSHSDSNDRPSSEPELLEAIQAHRVASHEATTAARMLGRHVRYTSKFKRKILQSKYNARVMKNFIETLDRESQFTSEAETAMHKLHATKQRLYTALFHHKFKVSS